MFKRRFNQLVATVGGLSKDKPAAAKSESAGSNASSKANKTAGTTTKRAGLLHRQRSSHSDAGASGAAASTDAGSASRRSDEIRRRLAANSTHAPAQTGSTGAQTAVRTRSAAAPRRAAPLTGKRSSHPLPARGPSGPPPVMARTRQTSAGRTRSGSRRRFDLLLGAPGAEMRLPATPYWLGQLHFGWRLASFLMLAFLAAALYYVWNAPQFRVDAARVTGLQRISSGEVNRELGLTGKPIFTLDAEQIRTRLVKSFPEFATVETAVVMPDTLLITVTERVPVLIWRENGQDRLVDTQGITFPTREGVSLGAYPLVEASGPPPQLVVGACGATPGQSAAARGEPQDGSNPCPESETEAEIALEDQDLLSKLPLPPGPARPYLTPEMVQAVLTIAGQAPGGAQITYSPLHGFGWKDKRGWDVYLGSFMDQFRTKLLVYESIMKHLKTIGARPTLISVEFAHAPYYRLEP